MSAISSGRILVTGANGFIAVWVVKKLLEKGYLVQGAVRSNDKGAYLKKIFKEYADKFEAIVVEDITKEGAFDEAVKGVDAIEHTASPSYFTDDPAELITPAVQGTVGILASAHKYGDSVKRIVVTSSCSAVRQLGPNPRVFSEADWNNLSVTEVEAKGKDASGSDKYDTSKMLAERAAWAYMEKNKADLKFDLVVLDPPYVFGPVLHEISDIEKLNSSMYNWWQAVNGKKDDHYLATEGSSWVDVRDLARAHVLSIETEAASGNRTIVSEGPYKWQDWVNAAHEVNPKLPVGTTAYDASIAVHYTRYDVSKADKLFGLKYITIAESTKDILDDFAAKKWLG